jgi:hypothetical protein
MFGEYLHAVALVDDMYKASAEQNSFAIYWLFATLTTGLTLTAITFFAGRSIGSYYVA